KEKGLNKPVGRRRSGGEGEKSSPYQGEAGRGLIVEEKPLLAKIEREVSLAPRIIQNDKLSLVVQDENRQVQIIPGEEKSQPGPVSGLGCWFLKAGELCLCGLQAFSALLSSSLKEDSGELLAKNETLLYLPLLGKKSSPYQGEAGRGIEEITDANGFLEEALAAITGRKYSNKDVQAYLESLKQVGSANLGLFVQESLGQKEVLGLKFILEDGASFFIDGSTRSIWSKNHIPLEFSQGLSKVRDYLTSAIIQDNSPLIGQASPGFTNPTTDLLNFIAAFSGQKSDQAIKRIEFYDNENKLIESLEPIPLKRHYFVLGIWPWQYPDRSILEKEGLRLIGYEKDAKEILVILTNLPENEWDDQRVISLYLERWPNLEAGYQDLLDKIGHYFEVKKTCFLPEKSQIAMPKGENLDINQILGFWRLKLNSFCQRHFFPLKYAEADFSLLQERFYGLPGSVRATERIMEIILSLPQGFLYADDLAYACQRVNEADIRLGDGRRLKLLSK
ncbi:MAG: hypothetical protein Q7J72_03960, partial [Candidatus Omnitrophota bacterium]|nr:hypothetical protein [Candidatus Omnitrophota bacterium]